MPALLSFAFSRQSSAATPAGVVAAIAMTVMAFPLQALAQGAPAESEGATWAIGLGAANKQEAYRGKDRKTQGAPLLYYENQYVKFIGAVLEVKLPGLTISDTQRVNFGLIGEYADSGYKAKDSPFLAGMDERKGGFWVGGKVKWENEWADLSARWMTDASGHSKGQQLTVGLERSFHLGSQVTLSPRFLATWQDRKTVDYYHGVRANEARPNRAAYQGESGVNTELAMRGTYTFNPQHSVVVDVGVTRLHSGIRNSPLVDRSCESNVFVGYLYRFQ